MNALQTIADRVKERNMKHGIQMYNMTNKTHESDVEQ